MSSTVKEKVVRGVNSVVVLVVVAIGIVFFTPQVATHCEYPQKIRVVKDAELFCLYRQGPRGSISPEYIDGQNKVCDPDPNKAQQVADDAYRQRKEHWDICKRPDELISRFWGFKGIFGKTDE